ARPGNTFDAHRLLHLAGKAGLQDDLAERLFAATFTEGEPIGAPDTILELAIDVGVPEGDARRVLDTQQFAEEVRADEVEAMQLGVRGVPFFLIDRRVAVSGAQPPTLLVDVLRRAWPKEDGIEIVGGGRCDGGDDTCDL